MPCSFCRSRSHNIRYCNSPEVQHITENLFDEAIYCAQHCNYQRFSDIIDNMSTDKIKIACIHWHNTVSPVLYQTMLDSHNTIPEIRCNFNREKYRFIAMWLYLVTAYYISDQEDVIPLNGYLNTQRFQERLEYLRRIVINGMSPYQSFNIYVEFIINMGQLDLNEVRRNYYDLASYGYSNSLLYEEEVSKTKKFSFIIEQGDAEDFKKDIRIDEEESHTDCPICYENITNSCVVLGCKHNQCTDCFVTYLKSRQNTTISCAICRANICRIKTYNQKCTDTLNAFIHAPEKEEELVISHIPERFEDGDNIVINLV